MSFKRSVQRPSSDRPAVLSTWIESGSRAEPGIAGRASIGDVQETLGVSRPVTIEFLRAMQEAGLITRVGKSERDPRAYWQPRVE